MGFNIFKYEKAKVTLWEHHFRAFNREMVNISGLNLVNEASNATEVEMESCSESMAPGAWSSASPSLTIDKFKNDGHPKVNRFLTPEIPVFQFRIHLSRPILYTTVHLRPELGRPTHHRTKKLTLI